MFRAGFPKLIFKIAPFSEIRKKIAPLASYSNFPLEGTLIVKKVVLEN